MKKLVSGLTSAVLCVGLILSAAAVSAETTVIEPDYPVNGNKCGTVLITPELDRNVYIKIEQITEEGNYKYYDTVISADSSVGNTYSFTLEGKEDVSYIMTVGVPKYKGSDILQLYSYEFIIRDTDYITDDNISGYVHSFAIVRNEEFEEPVLDGSSEAIRNENNFLVSSAVLSFPLSDITPGDVNFDGVVDLYDAIGVAKYLIDSSYFSGEQILAGDYNGSGEVDLYDVIDIAKTLF